METASIMSREVDGQGVLLGRGGGGKVPLPFPRTLISSRRTFDYSLGRGFILRASRSVEHDTASPFDTQIHLGATQICF